MKIKLKGRLKMTCTHRLVYCNDQFHVILPNKWVKAVNIQKGDYVTLEIDNNDLNKLIVKKDVD